jgi:hypothetical protein
LNPLDYLLYDGLKTVNYNIFACPKVKIIPGNIKMALQPKKAVILAYVSFFVVFFGACERNNAHITPTPNFPTKTISTNQNTFTSTPVTGDNGLRALDIGDGGFLTEEPCGPPCFWNIIPATTQKQESIDIFQEHFNQYFGVSNCSQWPQSWNTQLIECKPVVIGFNADGYVEGISFIPTQSITVGDVISKYDDPNDVSTIGIGDEIIGKTKWVSVSLFFNKIRTIIILPSQDGTNYDVQPSTPVMMIVYPDDTIWALAKTQQLTQWKGFGEYIGPIYTGP